MHGRKPWQRRSTRPRTARTVPALLMLVLPALASLGFSVAQAHAGTYAHSQQPHWAVGHLDPDLSLACRHGRFNQLSDHRLHIGYIGEAGAGTTGIARQSWNLRDPDRRSRPEDTYHFADDGMSTCRVYVAKDPPPAGR